MLCDLNWIWVFAERICMCSWPITWEYYISLEPLALYSLFEIFLDPFKLHKLYIRGLTCDCRFSEEESLFSAHGQTWKCPLLFLYLPHGSFSFFLVLGMSPLRPLPSCRYLLLDALPWPGSKLYLLSPYALSHQKWKSGSFGFGGKIQGKMTWYTHLPVFSVVLRCLLYLIL